GRATIWAFQSHSQKGLQTILLEGAAVLCVGKTRRRHSTDQNGLQRAESKYWVEPFEFKSTKLVCGSGPDRLKAFKWESAKNIESRSASFVRPAKNTGTNTLGRNRSNRSANRRFFPARS